MPGSAGPQSRGTEQDRLSGEGQEGSVPGGETEYSAAAQRELQAWLSLVQQVMATGSRFRTVLGLELKLALGDSRRLILVSLAMIPLLLLAWLGLSVLAGWLVYLVSHSVALGLVGFVVVQLVALLWLRRAAKVYGRSLGLPASRRQLQAIMETGKEHAATATDS